MLQRGRRAFGRNRRTAEPLRGGGGLVAESWVSGGWPGGEAGQGALQVRPCKLGRRIHAAHAPALPPRPALDSSLRLTHHGKSTTRAKAGRFARKAEAASQPLLLWLLLPPLFLIFPWCMPESGSCPRPGGWAGRGCPRHGCRGQAPRDGFTASPDPPTHPANLMNRSSGPTTEGLRRSPTSAEGALSAEEKISNRRVDSQPPGSL